MTGTTRSPRSRCARAGGGGGNGRRGAGRGRGRGQGNVEQVIRRAYQDILQRDPDQSGMRTYRSRMIDDGWTEQDVRQALRESPEYRELNTMTMAKAQDIVRQAYLSVLRDGNRTTPVADTSRRSSGAG